MFRSFFWIFLLCVFFLSALHSFAEPPSYSTPWTADAPPPLPDNFETEAETDETTKPAPNLLPSDIQKTENSPVGDMYSTRTGEALHQFGYDLFGDLTEEETLSGNTPSGAVQDDFILNSGDELSITFTGQRSEQISTKIDSEGLLLLKDFPPIAAAGLSIGQLRGRLQAAAKDLHNTQVFVSLASVRQIGVLVVGHVHKPGRRTMTVFHTVTDALAASGGIKKDGSLRSIRLVRDGRNMVIDLYGLLSGDGSLPDIRLRDGDRLMIPPLGHTVAIAGAVKRPGIYELPPSSAQNPSRLTLEEALTLGGGVLSAGQNRFLKMQSGANGMENTEEVSEGSSVLFGDGAILMVARGQEKRSGTITLAGNTRRAGLHDLTRNRSLSTLLNSDQVLGDDIYPLIGVIERRDTEQLSTRFIAFPLKQVISGAYDQNLADNDTVHLFSNSDIQNIFLTSKKEENREENEISPTLQNFLKEQAATLRGAVRMPASYPVTDGITLENLIAASGGTTRDANMHSVEIIASATNAPDKQRAVYNLDETHPAAITINPGDSVRINGSAQNTENRSVSISGEILSPGTYDLLPDDKLSDLIERAGGLSPQSYPAGAIFSRESERRAEETRFRAAAQDLERSLAAAIQKEKDAPDATKIEMVRGLADELRTIKAVGRITVEADPRILSVQPELDILLEAGDRLYVPKRPLTVRVSGEVLSPASLQFRKEKEPLDYIHEAGSFTYHADKDRAFVLYPNGSAEPLQVSAWNHKAILIPPGSTIVVPRDPKPFDFIESARDLTQIFSNLAVTSIFIDDLRE